MFTDIFVRILQDKQLTPYKVAKGTGISQGLMSEYANGKRTPSTKNLTKIANFLNVPVDTLLSLDTQTDEQESQCSDLYFDTLTPKERKTVESLLKNHEALSNYSELSTEEQQMINDIIATIAKHKRKK